MYSETSCMSKLIKSSTRTLTDATAPASPMDRCRRGWSIWRTPRSRAYIMVPVSLLLSARASRCVCMRVWPHYADRSTMTRPRRLRTAPIAIGQSKQLSDTSARPDWISWMSSRPTLDRLKQRSLRVHSQLLCGWSPALPVVVVDRLIALSSLQLFSSDVRTTPDNLSGWSSHWQTAVAAWLHVTCVQWL